MAKSKSIYICSNCGAQSPKWVGQCKSCGEWNTFEEEVFQKNISGRPSQTKQKKAKAIPLAQIEYEKEQRIDTENKELNRVLGGGLVRGSMVLIGGEPGIGKSTLALQVALDLRKQKTLYVSGEESLQQIKLRAERIGEPTENCLILSETLLEDIFIQFETHDPDIIIIDSVQTIYSESIESAPGSVTQVRECTNRLLKYVKYHGKPIFLIGHINKSGHLAGPKVLEHIVDTVLQFEGDRHHLYRILRATKNRYGATGEPGIFEMQQNGLREVSNPSELLLSHNEDLASGISVASAVEGVRPLMTEIQALVSNTAFSTPQRTSTGFDNKRLNMLLAVVEKRAGYKISTKDVFINLAGGIRIDDPAIDLAVVSSVLSSGLDIPLPRRVCFAGEIGLSGEIRPVTRIDQRIKEAEKLGFTKIYVSKYNKGFPKPKSIEVIKAAKIEEAFRSLFRKQ
ncbi:MAG: DNA repair protein RadA [Bacteroidota bacterium]|nr:DNA repair protein RadA [Bacteroidota bacterium]